MKLAALAVLVAACGGASGSSTSTGTGTGTGSGTGDDESAQIAAIEKAMNEYSVAVHSCWARAAADDHNVAGQIVLEVVIGGSDPKVDVLSDEPKDPVLTSCLTQLWKEYPWPAGVFGPGDAVQLPFDFVAPLAQYSVAAAHAVQRDLGDGKSTVRLLLTQRNTGNDQAAMTMLSIEGGLRIPMHRHSATELLFVFSGTGTLHSLDGAAKGSPLVAGTGVYIPAGTAHAFQHTGDEPFVALQLYTPAGPEQRFLDPQAGGTTPVPDSERRRRGKKEPQPIVRPSAQVDKLKIADGKATVAIMFERANAAGGAAYLGLLTASPGMSIPEHVHDGSSEYLFIVSGEGEMYVAGKAFPVHAEDAVQVPPGIKHAFVVKGDEPVKAIQFYVPSGPEQRFKPNP